MSRPPISHTKLSEHLSLSERHPDSECCAVNWWLHDRRVGWNIAMRAKTRDEAFVEAIEFWARRAEKYEKAYTTLKGQVDAFVNVVNPPEDGE